MANIQELSPKIIEAFHLEKIFLEREIQSMQQYLNKEVDRRTDRKSASEDLLNMKEQDKMRLCSHCQKKNDGLCRVCSHKFSQRKPQRSSSAKLKAEFNLPVDQHNSAKLHEVANIVRPLLDEAPDLNSAARPPSNDTQQSKLRSRIQDARDEHFFSDDL